MTRKDFELIASAIKDSRTNYSRPNHNKAVNEVAYNMADALAETNSKFDHRRFLTACGLEED